MPKDLQTSVRANAQLVRYRAGALIHQRGDAANSVSIIQTGAVRISNITSKGDRITIAELGAGESFGPFSLLTERLRSHDAHARSDVKLLELKRTAFRFLLDEAPELRDHVITHLERCLVRALEAIEGERSYPLKVRLAKLLLQRGAGESYFVENVLPAFDS